MSHNPAFALDATVNTRHDLAGTRSLVNLADQHLAILLVAFLNAGLHTALSELVTTHGDVRLCVRGTILLAKVCAFF